MLTEELAERFARVALANVGRDYPRRIDHRLASAGEELRPRIVHPAFYGAYDWHSAVHMHWTLVRVLRLYPVSRSAPAIAETLDEHLSPEALARELDYFRSPAGRTFERPYGWAWLLELQAEALRAQTARWSQALAPLATEIASRMTEYLRAAPYPVRAGSHGNSAFACLLALDYATTARDGALELATREGARRWFERDRGAPLAYEPSLDDFLSPSLCEAVLMQAVLAEDDFRRWLERFAPEGFATLMAAPEGYDPADPKQSHLDGLCFSRAWCFARLGSEEDGKRLLAAALPHVTGDYAGEHWLATFALLALSSLPIAAALKSP
ncbi:MAG TPA: DUF2891 domain-containing protein [Burkholderiales bacterium]|nr:DUF2891 domain-containing protein [Burkholderiales bacterium]